ncbi:hypothetical protein Ocin01_11214 [Orchesella cincta]|uniref:Uncharacterized protein n=1 Tax=Orchesella cincta TaxID=48709 RepID=A0A1D2MRB1_ORCCI|nr:hypothetical protein Ocin01_11214 [Orchesella cincta]
MGFNPCCCISSKTGAKIIAYFDLAVAVLGILFFGFMYVSTIHIQNVEDPVVKEQFIRELRKGYEGHPYLENADEETLFSTLKIQQLGLLVWLTISLVLVSVLIHGLRKERPRLIQVYLIVSGVGSALIFCVFIIGGLVSDTIFALSGSFISILLSVVVTVYTLAVVYAAYVEIRNKLLQDQNPAVKYEHA